METWDIVDERRNNTGKYHTRGHELKKGEFHVVVEVFTINADGRLLLTQRDAAKPYPLLWEGTGGSIIAGETSKTGALRELKEETGLSANLDDLQLIGELKRGSHFLDNYIWKRRELIHLEELVLQDGEVIDAKLVTYRELKEMKKAGLIVPPVWDRLELYKEYIKKLAGAVWE